MGILGRDMVAEGGSVELGPALERLELPPEFKLSSMIDCGGLVQMVQQLMLALQKQTDRSDALEATVATMQEEIRRLNCHVAAQAAIQMSNGALLDGYRDDIEIEIAIPGEITADDSIDQSADEIVAVTAVKEPSVSVKAPEVVTKPVKRPPPASSPQQLLHPLRTFSTTPAGVSSEVHDRLIERVAALEATSLEPGQWKQRNELEILWARVHSFEETLKEFTDLIANGAQGDGEERDLAALFRFPIRCLSCNSQSSPPVRRPSPPRE